MFLINRIVDKCVVEDSSKCLSSAYDLLLMVNAILSALGRGGQLLSPEVPRTYHICGIGFLSTTILAAKPNHREDQDLDQRK
jgi:hypothetical protein